MLSPQGETLICFPDDSSPGLALVSDCCALPVPHDVGSHACYSRVAAGSDPLVCGISSCSQKIFSMQNVEAWQRQRARIVGMEARDSTQSQEHLPLRGGETGQQNIL